ncbi:ABC-three component system protein [Microvirga soli]|uniref:ABC-three component system protein n=1 Tax=Microvirga soli TaxID=1854496 RepID=UPI00191CBC9B|nr:ABC-three component system protein [Microvirga soli]
MTSEQRWQWQALLELTLRRLHGDAFQGFFSKVMSKLHGDDFVPVRAFGRRGDKGCDGYLLQSGQLFQCYGKLHDAALNVDNVVNKISDDYAKAAAGLAPIMQEWHFVHNLFDGLPVEALIKLKELETANRNHRFGAIGPQGFEDRVFRLAEDHIIALLGPAATAEDTQNMRLEEVSDLIKAVMLSVDADQLDAGPVAAVPYDKLEFNKITGCWSHLLLSGFRNTPHVRYYIDQHPDAELGTRLAKIFRDRYEDLNMQGLSPNAIMRSLYEGVTGIGSVTPERQVAAHALLAYLFEACDIFEDHPSKVNA